MSNVERNIMADATAPESGTATIAPPEQEAGQITEESGEPKVIITEEGYEPTGQFDRARGPASGKVQVLAKNQFIPSTGIDESQIENVTTQDQQATEEIPPWIQERDITAWTEWQERTMPPGGEGRDGGPPEVPRGPRDPDFLWSPEFREWGISVAREIIYLEAEVYDNKYDPQKHPAYNPRYSSRLDEAYQEWRIWKNMDRKRAFNSPPFKSLPEMPLLAQLSSAQAEQEEPLKQDDLEDLPLLKELKDEDGNIIERGLLKTYNILREENRDPDNPNATEEQIDQRIEEVEGQLSRYFREAKRLGLLNGIDQELRLMYVDIMRGVHSSEKGRKLGPAGTWDTFKIDSEASTIARLGERSFHALRRFLRKTDRQMAQHITKLDGIWDVYTELAGDRFSLLLNMGGLTEESTIDGEFTFGGESLEELNQWASNEEQIRRLFHTDDELRNRANALFSEPDQADLREEELTSLIRSRERVVREALRDRDVAVSRYGEDRARFRQMAEESELYWQPTYANYFEVFARTPEQFQIAVQTFIQWIRSGLTKSPSEIFQRARGFLDALTTAGIREHMPDPVMIGLRWELEGMTAVLGANYANENYKGDYYEQFMNFGAAEEGPQRFVRLSRAFRGKLGAVLWKLDYDRRVELLHSPHGSRGQLMEIRDPLAWEELQAQVKNLLIAEVLGMEIKGYHVDDPYKLTKIEYDQMIKVLENRLRELESKSGSVDEIKEIKKELEELRQRDPLEDNLEEIATYSADENFQNLYEGFDLKEQDRLYQELKGKQETQNLLPPERRTLIRLERVKRIQKDLERGISPGELKGEDRRLYQEAKNAVESALELYGVIGEKARRGGGVFLVDRNIHIEAYDKLKGVSENGLTDEQKKAKRIAEILMQVRKGRKINETKLKELSNDDQQFFASLTKEDMGDFVDYVPIYWAEKFVQFAENWVKATYGGEFDETVQAKLEKEKGRPVKGIPADELQFRVDQARRMAIWALKTYGFQAKLYDFTLLKDGKPIDPNTVGYVNDSLGVPYGIDHSAENDVVRYKYSVPENPRILGYNDKGQEVILVFDNDGRPITGDSTGLKFDPQTGQAIIFDQQQQSMEVGRVNEKGIITKVNRERIRITIDNLKADTPAAEVMKLNKPILKHNKDGSIYRPQIETHAPNGVTEISYGKPVTESVEQVAVDFDIATHHPYSRWTGHPYWGYQEEDTGLVISDDAFAGADRIKKGQSEPEYEEPHATHLLVVDPTLQRISHFEHRESREDKVALDAVEESYQGHWLITDELHMAFYAANADDEYNRIAYVEQDWGGLTKIWLNPRAIYARWTDMLGRRGRTMLPVLPLHFSSMAGMHGEDGALGELRMMNYGKLGERGSYRIVGQFALEKWIGQTESAQDMWERLTGYINPQEKRDREGYLEKPTDDADVTLEEFRDDLGTLRDLQDVAHEYLDIRFMAEVRKSRGRKEGVIQAARVLETSKRGERGPRWNRGRDIYERNADGSIKRLGGQKVFNSNIDWDQDVGSSRHSNTLFFWRDVVWDRSARRREKEQLIREGKELYENVGIYYDLMDLPQIAERRLARDNPQRVLRSRWDQELGKEVR